MEAIELVLGCLPLGAAAAIIGSQSCVVAFLPSSPLMSRQVCCNQMTGLTPG